MRKHAKETPKTTEKVTGKQTVLTQMTIDEKQISPPPTDIQAVLTVIQPRKLSYGNGENNHLDLSKTNLQGAYLSSANLERAYLSNTKLQEAEYTDKTTSRTMCLIRSKKYPCPTIFPPNFDPKAAGMTLLN